MGNYSLETHIHTHTCVYMRVLWCFRVEVLKLDTYTSIDKKGQGGNISERSFGRILYTCFSTILVRFYLSNSDDLFLFFFLC